MANTDYAHYLVLFQSEKVYLFKEKQDAVKFIETEYTAYLNNLIGALPDGEINVKAYSHSETSAFIAYYSKGEAECGIPGDKMLYWNLLEVSDIETSFAQNYQTILK